MEHGPIETGEPVDALGRARLAFESGRAATAVALGVELDPGNPAGGFDVVRDRHGYRIQFNGRRLALIDRGLVGAPAKRAAEMLVAAIVLAARRRPSEAAIEQAREEGRREARLALLADVRLFAEHAEGRAASLRKESAEAAAAAALADARARALRSVEATIETGARDA